VYLVTARNRQEQPGMDRRDRIRKKQTGIDRIIFEVENIASGLLHHTEIHLSDRKSRSKGKPH
jgi:hypothetical protein